MANGLKGEASFDLGGQSFTLVYNAAAFLRIEDATGVGIFQTLGVLQAASRDTAVVLGQIRLGTLAHLVAEGLRTHHPDITRDEAAEMLLSPDAQALQEAMGRALTNALPQQDQAGNAGKAGKPRNGTGKKP